MDLVFLVGAIAMVFAVLFSLLLKEVPLRMESGLQAQRSAEAADAAGAPDAAGATHDADEVAVGPPAR